MRCKILLPLVVLPLLGACVGSDQPATHAPNGPMALEDATSLRETDLHYTSHLPVAAKPRVARPEIIRIAIDERFDAYDRAKILRAVNEWNHVLNGFVRLDIGPAMDGQSAAERTQTWTIMAARDDNARASRGELFGNALAVTYPLNRIGGMVLVYVDRVGRRDLVGVMRHELGHVLGLGHDSHGRLMSSRYAASEQQCIDKAAAQAIAANRKLPAAGLNWCEASVAAGKTKSDL